MRGFLWTALAVGGLGAAIAAYSLRPRAPEPRAAVTPAPARAPVTVATTQPSSVAPAPSTAAAPAARASAPIAASPPASAEPSTSPVESLDDMRQQAALGLDGGLKRLAGRVESFRTNLRDYENGCHSGGGPWPAAGCDAFRQDLRKRLEEIRTSLESLEEDARRASVYPGVRAQLRRQHGLDEDAWDALRRLAVETLE